MKIPYLWRISLLLVSDALRGRLHAEIGVKRALVGMVGGQSVDAVSGQSVEQCAVGRSALLRLPDAFQHISRYAAALCLGRRRQRYSRKHEARQDESLCLIHIHLI